MLFLPCWSLCMAENSFCKVTSYASFPKNLSQLPCQKSDSETAGMLKLLLLITYQTAFSVFSPSVACNYLWSLVIDHGTDTVCLHIK